MNEILILVCRIKSRISMVFRNKLRNIIFSSHQGWLTAYVKLLAVYILLVFDHSKNIIGSLWTKPSFISQLASLVGINHNLNHLGNVYAISLRELWLSRKIEKKVIEWCKLIFKCSNQNIEGYVTSGGTESNMYLMWAGREWLRQHRNKPCALVVSDFTHYSICKIGRILDIKKICTPISKTTWGIDPLTLKDTLNNLYKRNYVNILLPITLGYSSTGAFDPLDEIISTVQDFKKKHKNFNVFLWIDAAMQGLPLAFLDSSFKPFDSPLIQGLVIDFHKLGDTAIPSGVVLYRKSMRRLIQTSIDYLDEKDATISGSRPGFSALAIWVNTIAKNNQQWKIKFTNLYKDKEIFIHKFNQYFPLATIISTKYSLTCCIVINNYFKRLPQRVEKKFALNVVEINYQASRVNKSNNLRHYKIHVLPHNSNYLTLFLKGIRHIGKH